MGRFVDSVIAYRILRMLVTPFEETDAYKLGIVDAHGKELKKMSQLHTAEERDAYTILNRMVFRIKRIINKVPVENKKLVSFAAALSLIKEHANDTTEPLDLELQYIKRINSNLQEEQMIVEEFMFGNKIKTFKQFNEDGVAVNNAAATPGVAGLTGEPPVSPRNKLTIPMLRRKKQNVTSSN